jgi:hypothetical protein
MKNIKNQRGAIVLIFVLVMTVIILLFLAVTQAQLLLSLRRNASASDSLIAYYDAESEINDIFAKLLGGYIDSDDFPFVYEVDLGGTSLKIEGEDVGGDLTVTVTADRAFAVSKLKGTLKSEVVSLSPDLEIILALDCTGSMNQPACPTCANKRIAALKSAVLNFVDRIIDNTNSDKIRLGVVAFSGGAMWAKDVTSGVELTPTNNHGLIRDAIEDGIDSNDVYAGYICDPSNEPLTGGTNVGAGYIFAHDYFSANPVDSDDVKRFEIVVTDGVPTANSYGPTAPSDPRCPRVFKVRAADGPKVVPFANDTLRCGLALTNQDWKPQSQSCSDSVCDAWEDVGRKEECLLAGSSCTPPQLLGLRSPEVEAYAVTVFSPVNSVVRDIFTTYAGPSGENYFELANANDLGSILEGIFDTIISKTSSITIERLIPD